MDPKLLTAVIAAATSSVTTVFIKPFIDRNYLIFKLKHEHRATQAKLVKEHIAKHKGNILKASESLKNRLNNLAKNHNMGWLGYNKSINDHSHYLHTTVFRFVRFYHSLSLLEHNLVFLDATNSTKTDKRILKHFRIAKDIMCDTDLFKGLNYDVEYETDHLFSTPFEHIIDLFPRENLITYEQYIQIVNEQPSKFETLYNFFTGMCIKEDRLRVERIKILHLFLTGFMNEYGYDFHWTSKKKLIELKELWGHFKLLNNYIIIRKKYKLKDMNWLLPQMEIYAVK